MHVGQIGQRLLELNPSIKIALAVLFLLILTLLLYPFQIVVVPEWNLQVVDDAGATVSGIKVTEHWQHYLLEDAGHEEQSITDIAGKVSFPSRTTRASLLGRAIARLSKFNQSGAAARRDRYASVVVWGDQNHSVMTTVLGEDEPPPQRLTVKRRH
jgi:hypothetical protein